MKEPLLSYILISILLCLPSISRAEEGDWTRKTDMPTGRAFLSTSQVNGKIYAIGGGGVWPLPVAVEEYDPVVDRWTKKGDMLTPRQCFAASAVNGKIYAIGGYEPIVDGKAVLAVEQYDSAKDKWTKEADMPTARSFLSTGVVNGKIYIIGGWRPGETLSTVEEYIPEDSQFSVTPKGKLPTKWGEVKSD